MEGGVSAKSPNDGYEIFLGVTFVVGNKSMWFEEQVKSGTIGHSGIIVAIIDVEAESDIRKKLGVLIYLFHGKCQGKNVLVEFCYYTVSKDN